MTQRKRRKAKTDARVICEAAINSLDLGDAVDGDLVLVLASRASDGSTALASWPHYLDHGKRVRALLEMAFQRSCHADVGGKS